MLAFLKNLLVFSLLLIPSCLLSYYENPTNYAYDNVNKLHIHEYEDGIIIVTGELNWKGCPQTLILSSDGRIATLSRTERSGTKKINGREYDFYDYRINNLTNNPVYNDIDVLYIFNNGAYQIRYTIKKQ